MKAEDKSKLIEVFKGSLWEAELVKGLLEANGVKSATKDGIRYRSQHSPPRNGHRRSCTGERRRL